MTLVNKLKSPFQRKASRKVTTATSGRCTASCFANQANSFYEIDRSINHKIPKNWKAKTGKLEIPIVDAEYEDMWKGLPSELPAGIDNVDYGNDTRGIDGAKFGDEGDYITSTLLDITTPYHGPHFSIPRKPLANDPANTRVRNQHQGMTKENLRGSFEVELRNADAELERALRESQITANAQPRLNPEER